MPSNELVLFAVDVVQWAVIVLLSWRVGKLERDHATEL